MSDPRIGFIGLGNVGGPLAGNSRQRGEPPNTSA